MSTDNIKTSRLVGLDSIVKNVLNDLGNYSEMNYKRYKQWAIRAVKQLNMYVIKQPEVSTFVVDSNNLVYVPDDMIDYMRIGVIYDRRIWTLSENKDIQLYRGESCGVVTVDSELTDAEPLPDLYTWLGAPPRTFNVAFYRYDKEYNRLIFSGDMVGETIVMEYISTGVSLFGDTYIPVQAEETVIAWVHRQRTTFDPQVTENERMRAHMRYKAAITDLHEFENSFTYDELLDTIRSGHTQLPKR